MDKKEFCNLMISRLKSALADEKNVSVTREGIKTKLDKNKPGEIYLNFSHGGTWLRSRLYYSDSEIEEFIKLAKPSYTPCQSSFITRLVNMDFWGSNPKPNFVNSIGAILVPKTQERTDEVIEKICTSITGFPLKFLSMLMNRDILVIQTINEYVKNNPRGGFEYPFYTCLFIAKSNSISFEEFESLMTDTKNMYGINNIKEDMMYARKILNA